MLMLFLMEDSDYIHSQSAANIWAKVDENKNKKKKSRIVMHKSKTTNPPQHTNHTPRVHDESNNVRSCPELWQAFIRFSFHFFFVLKTWNFSLIYFLSFCFLQFRTSQRITVRIIRTGNSHQRKAYVSKICIFILGKCIHLWKLLFWSIESRLSTREEIICDYSDLVNIN